MVIFRRRHNVQIFAAQLRLCPVLVLLARRRHNDALLVEAGGRATAGRCRRLVVRGLAVLAVNTGGCSAAVGSSLLLISSGLKLCKSVFVNVCVFMI